MRRRQFVLGLASGAGLATCPTCATLLAAETGHGATPHWTYEGAAGPANWAKMSPRFAACSGQRQSPIDLTSSMSAAVASLDFAYGLSPLEIVNNGHTIQVNYASGSILTVGGVRHALVQFHFHHPSEHSIDGQKSPMELHLVHRDEKDQLAVIGVMMRAGASHDAIGRLWAHMPMFAGPPKRVNDAQVNAAELLPAGRGSYQYFGSLTTPPCAEGVHWIMLKDPITASVEQIQKFAAAFPNNARPVQPINRRFLLRSQ